MSVQRSVRSFGKHRQPDRQTSCYFIISIIIKICKADGTQQDVVFEPLSASTKQESTKDDDHSNLRRKVYVEIYPRHSRK